MAHLQTMDVPVKGMDCTECTLHVQHAIAAVPGVKSVHDLLAAEKPSVRVAPLLGACAKRRHA